MTASLLSRRVWPGDVVLGRAYVIHARNGGVGVAVSEAGKLGYRLHREKFGEHFLFVEFDWAQGQPYGTAIPLALIDAEPPEDNGALLAWLTGQEAIYRESIDAAWAEVLKSIPPIQSKE